MKTAEVKVSLADLEPVKKILASAADVVDAADVVTSLAVEAPREEALQVLREAVDLFRATLRAQS